jgi:uncharacterized membrane protein YgdD (TMEM256/DUF423 family)
VLHFPEPETASVLISSPVARLWFGLGALNAFLAVAAGAFGAHALKSRLSPEMLAVFETGARYQMYHALGLLAVGALVALGRSTGPVGWLMLAGIVLFSGSLYALALTDVRALGAITPLGGLCFLIAWLWLAISMLKP